MKGRAWLVSSTTLLWDASQLHSSRHTAQMRHQEIHCHKQPRHRGRNKNQLSSIANSFYSHSPLCFQTHTLNSYCTRVILLEHLRTPQRKRYPQPHSHSCYSYVCFHILSFQMTSHSMLLLGVGGGVCVCMSLCVLCVCV